MPRIEKAGVAPRQPSSLLYSEACLALACFLAAARSPMGRARILLPAENSLGEFAIRFVVLGDPTTGSLAVTFQAMSITGGAPQPAAA